MSNQKETVRYLSDLAIGDVAVITKIKGYGAFQKRIIEMGFVSGTRVKAIKKAPFPFSDPVEYELMNYRISLRLSEARRIEIVSEEDIESTGMQTYEGTLLSDDICRIAKERGKTIQVALIGNPNSGKTTLFNHATGKHEHVGNYGGVTVDIKTAHFSHNGYRIELTDLPGAYSVSEYTPEELFVRKHLAESMPDVVVNVLDASALERNLFLTTQLIDMNIKVIIALNMYDELISKGDNFDYDLLGKMTGIPIVPTIASKGKGIDNLMEKIIEVYEEKESVYRHIHINYGEDINRSINRIKVEVKKNNAITDKYHSQYIALKLLERDKNLTEQVSLIPATKPLLEISKNEIANLESKYNSRIETIIADAKYAFIRGALKETYHVAKNRKDASGYWMDNILIDKWLGIPVFIVLMWLIFQITFTAGSYPVAWIEAGIDALNAWIRNIMPEGMLQDLLTGGIVNGMGSVVVFFPNILILFSCISFMEDTGYMARAAFIMDKLMHKIGLHGKSFIPMLIGFGCNVPAIMATRTLESRKDRLVTILIIPFMSCSSRLPTYSLLIAAFFTKGQGLIMFGIYAAGILFAIITALLFNKIFFKKQDNPFVMELPPYRFPTLQNITVHTWNKSVQYFTKIGTTILAASIIIWFLGYFPRPTSPEQTSVNIEDSYIGRFGHFIEPVLEPLGYDWKIGISILTGMGAKEIVVSTMSILYQSDAKVDGSDTDLRTELRESVFTSGKRIGERVFSPLTAFSLMLFILIYFPCVAVLAAIRKEAGLRWALFTACYTTASAWLIAFCIYKTGEIFL
ncbi:MAG: ferrous iron transport protein B [Dysgonamonadaceae bacterium]|nr:ferrous iron transport protein B [Dysgonamonadaceae bacterium]